MKQAAMAVLMGLVSLNGFAQQDSTSKAKIDTLHVGGMTIIRSASDKDKKSDSSIVNADTIRVGGITVIGKGLSKGVEEIGKAIENIDFSKLDEVKKEIFKKKKPKKTETNWFVVDIGFSGYNDKTNYSSAAAQDFMRIPFGPAANAGDFALRTTRVSNFNLWLFMKRVSLIKSVLNIKYGFGLESNNYFFKSGITYVDDNTSTYVTRNNTNLTKNKLVANYLTIPLMLNLNTNPMHPRRGLQLSAGISGGYLYSARQKQRGSGGMDKTKSNFNLEPFKLSYVGELGLGPVKLYGSVATYAMHKFGVEQVPYTVGLRFSN